MNTPYSPVKTTKTMKDFLADYNSDINAFVSTSLDNSQSVSRRLATETSVGKMLIDRYSQYVIGGGLSPIAAPERAVLDLTDEQYQKFTQQCESYWRMMTDTKEFDHFRRHTFKQLQQIAFRNILITGDVLRQRYYDTKPYGYRPRIKLINGTWVANPFSEPIDKQTLVGGVRLDASGREIGYCIKEHDPNTLLDNFQTKDVNKYLSNGFEAYDLVLLQVLEANQVRGIPFLTAVRESILDIATFTKAYVSKAVVQSLFTVFIEKDVDADTTSTVSASVRQAMVEGQKVVERETVDRGDGFSLNTGNILALEPGETAHLTESTATSASFKDFIEALLSITGGAVGIPVEMLLQSYNASFSASRATIASAYKGFTIVQKEFASKFCQPEWDQVIDYGIRMGAIEAPGYLDGDETIRKAYLSATWVGPSPVAVDPTKEIQFYTEAINAGLCTKEEAIQILFGKDFEETAERIAIEKQIEEGLGLTPEEPKAEETTETETEEGDDGDAGNNNDGQE